MRKDRWNEFNANESSNDIWWYHLYLLLLSSFPHDDLMHGKWFQIFPTIFQKWFYHTSLLTSKYFECDLWLCAYFQDKYLPKKVLQVPCEVCLLVKVDEIFFQFPLKRIRTGVMIFKTTVNHLDDVVSKNEILGNCIDPKNSRWDGPTLLLPLEIEINTLHAMQWR